MSNNRYPNRNIRTKKIEHNINELIKHPEVRVTGLVSISGEKMESQILPIDEALKLARSLGIDLVEVSPNATPPVCKIIEYQKFLYEIKMKKKEQEKNTRKQEVKELRLTPTTDEHDLNFKTNHAKNWLKHGDKVKAVVVFKGRQMAHKDMGEMLLVKLYEALEDICRVDQLPKLEGFRMSMLLSPKKNK